VRDVPGERNVCVSLLLEGRARNLDRPREEPLERPLARLRANILPPPPGRPGAGGGASAGARKKRQKGQAAAGAPAEAAAAAPAAGAGAADGEEAAPIAEDDPRFLVALYSDADAALRIDGATPNGDAWRAAALLQVGAQWYDVEYNPPTVERLALPAAPMVGFPILPLAALKFAAPPSCAWRWLRRGPDAGAEWQPAGCEGEEYTPRPADEGCWLRVECTPGRPADAAEGAAGALHLGAPLTADVGPVRPAPAATAAELRGPAAARPPPPSASTSSGPSTSSAAAFRVLTYNILADQYAASDYARRVLFNYCPPEQARARRLSCDAALRPAAAAAAVP